MFIYLDESGDLGFDFVRKRPSKKFVITVLVCENDAIIKGFKKAVRRTIRNKLAKSTDRVQELKGTSTALPIKDYFLRNVPQQGWGVYSVILNKERVYDHLKSKIGRKKLYNYLARFLLKRIAVPPETNAVNLFIDRSKTRQEIKDFNSYVEHQLAGLIPLEVPLNITHEQSENNAGLQAVDLFCWGIFRKYELEDEDWYLLYRKYVVFETEYLPEKKKDGP